ncbi:MAG: hypothetical protein JXR76_27685 [Deltaproteobacteria bacterium]|nr:hypothetical protein [Deltaproteobacteria bacterium]
MISRFGICFSLFIFGFFVCSAVSFKTYAANRVVVLRNPDNSVVPSVISEIARELNATGFVSEIIIDTPNENLEDIAGREDASAAIRLNMQGKSVEVWVADRMTGKMVKRTVALNPGGEPEESIVILAAVELLRASLMEIYATNSPKGDVAVSEEARNFAKPVELKEKNKQEGRISAGYLSVGAGGSYIVREGGVGGNGAVSLILAFHQKVRFSIDGRLTFHPHALTAPLGDVTIYPFVVRAQSEWIFRDPAYRLRPYAGLGMGVVFIYSKGNVNPEWRMADFELKQHNQTAIVPTPFVSSGLILRVTSQLALRIEATLGIATSITRIRMGDPTIARVGPPLFIMNMLLDISLW